MRKYFYWLIVIVLIGFLFSGCSGQAEWGSISSGEGSYSLNIMWPESPAAAGRYIPPSAQTITVSITGTGLASAVSSSVTRAGTATSTTITFNNLPAGAKVALVKAFDSGSKLLVQRKDSFVIYNGHTSTSSNIPLGIAVKISGTAVVFEPTSIEMTESLSVPFQNWTGLNLTVTGLGANIYLPGAYQTGSGQWIYSEGETVISDDTTAGVQGFPGAICVFTMESGPAWGEVVAVTTGVPSVSAWYDFDVSPDGKAACCLMTHSPYTIYGIAYNGTTWRNPEVIDGPSTDAWNPNVNWTYSGHFKCTFEDRANPTKVMESRLTNSVWSGPYTCLLYTSPSPRDS